MEIPISRDIRKYKTKDVGAFSFKEAGYIALAFGVGVMCYTVFHCTLEVCLIPIALILVFGFFKPCGMTVIQFLRTVGKEQMSPPIYYNETDMEYNLNEFNELYGDEYYWANTDELIQSTSDSNKLTKNERARVLT